MAHGDGNVFAAGGVLYITNQLRASLSAEARTFWWDLEGRVGVLEFEGLAIVSVLAVKGSSDPWRKPFVHHPGVFQVRRLPQGPFPSVSCWSGISGGKV